MKKPGSTSFVTTKTEEFLPFGIAAAVAFLLEFPFANSQSEPLYDCAAPTKIQGICQRVALTLAEVIFWISLMLAYYSLQRIAPNVQLEHEEQDRFADPSRFSDGVPVGLWQKQKWANSQRINTYGPNFCSTGGHSYTVGASFWRMALTILIGVLDLKVGAA